MDSTKLLYQKIFLQQKFFLYFRTKQIPRFWFRTSSLAKKQCAPARQKFRIHWGNSAGTLGTRFARPAFQLLKNRLVLFWCVYCTKSEPIFKTKWGNECGTPRVRGNVKVNRTLRYEFRHGSASVPPSTKNGARLHFRCSVSDLASPPRILFWFGAIPVFFFRYGGGGRGRVSPKEKLTEF